MKRSIFKFKQLLVLAVAVLLAMPTQANMDRLNKNFQKEFDVEKGSRVRIENRFGQINIENWDKNSVFIDVEVTVDHPSKEKSERMLAAISVSIEKVGNDVVAITTIDEKLLNSIGGNILGSSSKEIKIDYKVRMPKYMNLTLFNKFGDVFINEVTGHAKIELKYGNLKANRIVYGNNAPLSSLTLGYGNATIEEVDWLKLDIKYSNVTITRSKALAILSKYSKINVDNTSSMVLESKYDTYTIGRISNIVGESGYTNYRIEQLDKKLDISSRYGDIKVTNVPATFELIKFNGSYSSISAIISESAVYAISGEASYGSITYGSPNRVSRIEGNTKMEVSGTVGGESNSPAQVKINIRYGNARLR
jgi:hypothetical protein